jgi:hypothetical protein
MSNGGFQDAHEPEDSPEFDFRHHLFDTLILLGAKAEIANLVERSLDGSVSRADVDALRRYNIELITSVKSRLARIHKIQIRASSGD